jgi:hypothetical protein
LRKKSELRNYGSREIAYVLLNNIEICAFGHSCNIMDVVHRTETWAPSGDSFEYSHTTIIFKNSATGQYSHASTVRRYHPDNNVDIRELTLHAIPIADLFPSLQQLDAFTRAPNLPSANTYIKRPQLFAYPEIFGRYRISDLVLHEARM